MLKIKMSANVFDVPRVIFTLKSNPMSEAVIEQLRILVADDCNEGQEYVVFDDAEGIYEFFSRGASLSLAVVLFDGRESGKKRFRMRTYSRNTDSAVIPRWAYGAPWAVEIYSLRDSAGCARQLHADFSRNFRKHLGMGWFPWGRPRRTDAPPVSVSLPEHTDALIERLNSGPDLASAVAHHEYAMELPRGSKLSCIRVAPDPIVCQRSSVERIVNALRLFEQASNMLVYKNPEICGLLSCGVDMDSDALLRDIYFHPSRDCFTVDRSDLHYTGAGLFASEIDEMPGGFAEVVHFDVAYGMNQDRWKWCFDRLAQQGPVLFLVSSNWSKVYIPEMRWLADHMRRLGYDADIATDEDLRDLNINGYVEYRGRKIGTIWRQFPIFETKGKFADAVRAASRGLVNMVPEFGHYGNKTWFSIFRSHNSHYRSCLPADAYAVLDEILPDSHLVISAANFPFTIAGYAVESLDHLYGLPAAARDDLVLKVCGANTLTARSYGVFMGHGLSLAQWREWINERFALQQPFIVQRKLQTAVAHVPVKNLARNRPELFGCRLLIRPWTYDGRLISASCCAVPSITQKVHGRVDMAIVSVEFE